MRVFRWSIIRSLRRTSHGKLIHIRLSENDGSCILQVFNRLCCISRLKPGKNFGTACCKLSFNTHIIFDRHRNSCQRTGQFSCINLFLNFICLCIGPFFIQCHITVDCWLYFFCLLDYCPDCFSDCHLTSFYFSAQFKGCKF